MRNLFLLFLLTLIWSSISAQKINYSSDKKYQKIRLEVKYTTITKKSETQESEKVAFVQMPLATTKRVTYGALISDRK